MLRRSLLAAPLLAPLAGCAQPVARFVALQPRHQYTEGNPLKVLSLGDSLTYGYGSTPASDHPGYRRQLSRLLAVAGVPAVFSLAANNGSTCADMLPWVRQTVADTQPDLAILAIGLNDAVQSDATLAAFENRYAQLLIEIFYGKADVKILAVFQAYPGPEWMRPRVKAVNDAIFRQAVPGIGPHGTRIIGPADWQSVPYAYDFDSPQIHPGDAGYDVYGTLLFWPIARWLGLPGA